MHRARGALLLGARPAVAGGHRPAPGRRRVADHRRDRAVGRPGRQPLQGGPADLRAPARSAAAGHHPEDGRPGPAAVPGGDRVLPDERRHPGGRARRHGLATSTTCNASSCRPIFESHSGEKIDLQVAVQLAVVARFYERIGDHAVNIGERVRYLVTGWMPEHAGAARFATRAAASDPRLMMSRPCWSSRTRPSFVEALTVGLRREGFRVEIARDGVEALDRFDIVRPDLVLLDVMLPDGVGIDVCRELRKRSQVPIIMVTAKGVRDRHRRRARGRRRRLRHQAVPAARAGGPDARRAAPGARRRRPASSARRRCQVGDVALDPDEHTRSPSTASP